MENFEKFKENNLPDEKYIFNSLKNCSIWDEEYLRAIDISNIFNIKHLVEYHEKLMYYCYAMFSKNLLMYVSWIMD